MSLVDHFGFQLARQCYTYLQCFEMCDKRLNLNDAAWTNLTTSYGRYWVLIPMWRLWYPLAIARFYNVYWTSIQLRLIARATCSALNHTCFPSLGNAVESINILMPLVIRLRMEKWMLYSRMRSSTCRTFIVDASFDHINNMPLPGIIITGNTVNPGIKYTDSFINFWRMFYFTSTRLNMEFPFLK